MVLTRRCNPTILLSLHSNLGSMVLEFLDNTQKDPEVDCDQIILTVFRWQRMIIGSRSSPTDNYHEDSRYPDPTKEGKRIGRESE